MSDAELFKVHFLGVRGSAPCAGPDYVKYGGHTSCVVIEIGTNLLICDAGSGIINASSFGFNNVHKSTYLLMSHTHLDHVMGLPFYGPIWDGEHTVQFYAGHLHQYGGLQTFLSRLFNEPIFPVPFMNFPAKKVFNDFKQGDILQINDVQINTHMLNHPNGATGYRICMNGVSVCYITDHEHGDGDKRQELINFISHADMLIYDSTYDDHRFSAYKGWGHSTWQEAVRLGNDGQVKKIVIFHHDPSNTDDKMDNINNIVAKEYDNVVVARQGLSLNLVDLG